MSGWIGYNLAKRMFEKVPSATVSGIDNMSDYYDSALKDFRQNELVKHTTFTFIRANIADKALIMNLFGKYKPAVVVNLAAQADVEHLVYASSSVYGSNKKVSYGTDNKVDDPVSLYAATKKSNELMAHAYSKQYNIPSILPFTVRLVAGYSALRLYE